MLFHASAGLGEGGGGGETFTNSGGGRRRVVGGGGGRGHTLQAEPNPVEALDTGGPSYLFTK